jgi:hypothetical protein
MMSDRVPREDRLASVSPRALILLEESYRSQRDQYTSATSAAPVFESEKLCHLVEGLWLTDASMVQDPDNWPGWTDLPFDVVVAMLGGHA